MAFQDYEYINQFLQWLRTVYGKQEVDILELLIRYLFLHGIVLFPERIGRALYYTGKINFLRFEPSFQITPGNKVIWEEKAPMGYIFFIYSHDLYVDKDGVLEVKVYLDNKPFSITPRVYNHLFPRPRHLLLPCQYFKVIMINHDTTDTVTIQHAVEYSLIPYEAWNRFVSKLREVIDKVFKELGIPL